MPTFYADIQTVVNGPQGGLLPATRTKVNRQGGRLRYVESQFVVPSGTAIGDIIYWCKLPVQSRIVGHMSRLVWTAGAASSTLNLGDNIVPARHLGATAVTTAGSAVPTAAEQVATGTANTVTGSNVLTVTASPGAFEIGNLIAGTGIPTGAVITGISQNGSNTLVSISSAATATGSAVAMTMTGTAYHTTDDSNTVANSFGSTTDDSSIRSTVAGAALQANQVITLKLVYVQD